MSSKLYARYTNPDAGYYTPDDLTLGERYEVEHVIMGSSYTSIFLVGHNGGYNSVNFDFENEDGSSKNIFGDPQYNPYLRRQQ